MRHMCVTADDYSIGYASIPIGQIMNWKGVSKDVGPDGKVGTNSHTIRSVVMFMQARCQVPDVFENFLCKVGWSAYQRPEGAAQGTIYTMCKGRTQGILSECLREAIRFSCIFIKTRLIYRDVP